MIFVFFRIIIKLNILTIAFWPFAHDIWWTPRDCSFIKRTSNLIRSRNKPIFTSNFADTLKLLVTIVRNIWRTFVKINWRATFQIFDLDITSNFVF